MLGARGTMGVGRPRRKDTSTMSDTTNSDETHDMGCLRGCLLGFGMVVAALLLLFMVAGFIGWLS